MLQLPEAQGLEESICGVLELHWLQGAPRRRANSPLLQPTVDIQNKASIRIIIVFFMAGILCG
jgi:hypothetical protein